VFPLSYLEQQKAEALADLCLGVSDDADPLDGRLPVLQQRREVLPHLDPQKMMQLI
jgi:hypothetical protein